MSDEFGDRIKSYESVFTSITIAPPSYLCVRIDGRGFSKFTRGLKKPFDPDFSELMILTAEHLTAETHAAAAYVQSDEISLFYTPKSEYIFGGRVSKINSVFASIATAHFNHNIRIRLPQHCTNHGYAYFDCRAFAVPSLTEASNVLLWRVQDARKNSISSLFRWTAGHSKMHGLSGQEMIDYLKANCAVDWHSLDNRYRYGTYLKPTVHETELSEQEWAAIPEKHRPPLGSKVTRSRIERIDLGYFGDLSLDQRRDFLNNS